MHFAPDENLIRQYLQDEEIARDFGSYYQLYAKYRQDYRIPEILSGSLDESVVESLCTLAAHAPTDERLTVAGLLLDGWNTLFLKFREEDQFAVALQSVLRQARASLLEGNTLAAFTEQYRTSQKSAWKTICLTAWKQTARNVLPEFLSKVSPALSRNVFLLRKK